MDPPDRVTDFDGYTVGGWPHPVTFFDACAVGGRPHPVTFFDVTWSVIARFLKGLPVFGSLEVPVRGGAICGLIGKRATRDEGEGEGEGARIHEGPMKGTGTAPPWRLSS